MLQMKWLRVLKVVVLVTLVLVSVLHFFWILAVPQNELFGGSEKRQFGGSPARVLKLASVQRNLTRLHRAVEKCLVENGDGIKATNVQGCKIRLQYPNGTENSWVYRRPKSGARVQEAENLSWDYDLCSLMKYWKQARTRPAVVTKAVLDCYLEEETMQRVRHHFVSRDRCKMADDCFHRVRSFLPLKQPFAPGQGGRCALVGNAASLISNVTFGREIDAHDTVIRLNDARTGDKYVNWTGQKTTFRFVNEKITKALVPFIRKNLIRNGIPNTTYSGIHTSGNRRHSQESLTRGNALRFGKPSLKCGPRPCHTSMSLRYCSVHCDLNPLAETLVLRRALGGLTLKRLQAGGMGNLIYVSPINQEGSGLEADPLLGYSSGVLALNFAISICKSVDIYGFSVDPGPQPSWPRYFSGPKFGHMPLTNRAYFLLLECLRVVRLKSAKRVLSSKKTTLPAAEVIQHGYTAATASQDEYKIGYEPINPCHY